MADGNGDVSLLLPGDHSGGAAAGTSESDEYPVKNHDQCAVPNEREHYNPALEIRVKKTLDIEPFPPKILDKINPQYDFRPKKQDNELVAPIVCLYKLVFERVPTTLEEAGTIWCGTELGKTAWVKAKRLGAFPTPLKDSNTEAPIGEESKSATIQRKIASCVDAGDNHITLLTAAYCLLFDRIWRHNPRSTVANVQQSAPCKDPIDAFGACRTSAYHK
jgi:hypothetical protein